MAQFLDETGTQFLTRKIKNRIQVVTKKNFDESDIEDNIFCVVDQLEIDKYFNLTAISDGDITIEIDHSTPAAVQVTSISYSKDGSNWVDTLIDTTIQTISIPVSNGDIVYLKGVAKQWDKVEIKSTANISAGGNIMSLFYGDEFADKKSFPSDSSSNLNSLFAGNDHLIDASNLILPATTLTNSCYYSMFNSCTSLTSAPELPATTLTNSCYYSMFAGCTSLTSAPELPANALTNTCYCRMFQNCTSLTSAPELPATTLEFNCYYNMFNGCTSLIAAPELPATVLTDSCYNSMFYNCTSLKIVPKLPATTLSSSCYNSMFAGCTSLTSVPGLPATTLASDCYNSMFNSCTSLTSAPELPATVLASGCYYAMFAGCTSLTSAPELPATTLTERCYARMFFNCSSLNNIVMLAEDISANGALGNWVRGVSSTGTFTKAASMTTLPDGFSGIPTGWTVVDYQAAT